MKRLTIKTVNKNLPKGYELFKSEGCYYFAGDGEYGSTYDWYTSTVYVNILNHLTLEQWIEEFNYLAEEYGTKVSPQGMPPSQI